MSHMYDRLIFQIQRLKLPNGSIPFDDWLDRLDETARIRILLRLQRVADGNLGDVKRVGSGVSELRFTFGSGYRVYFGMGGSSIIILLVGGTKRTQTRDISKAKALWAKYRNDLLQSE